MQTAILIDKYIISYSFNPRKCFGEIFCYNTEYTFPGLKISLIENYVVIIINYILSCMEMRTTGLTP